MQMYTFSEHTELILRGAGWEPERRIDTTSFRRYLVGQGYPYHEAVDRFLQEFGNLHISYPRLNAPPNRGDIDIYPLDAAEAAWFENVWMSSQEIGKSLCVVGSVDQAVVDLLMAEDAYTYADYSGILYLAGVSGEEALENIISGKKLPRLN